MRNLRRECKFVPRGIGMQGNVKRIKGRVPEKKTAVLLDFVQMRGGEGPAQFFWQLSMSVFWSIKGAHFLQNATNLNFKLFFKFHT